MTKKILNTLARITCLRFTFDNIVGVHDIFYVAPIFLDLLEKSCQKNLQKWHLWLYPSFHWTGFAHFPTYLFHDYLLGDFFFFRNPFRFTGVIGATDSQTDKQVLDSRFEMLQT